MSVWDCRSLALIRALEPKGAMVKEGILKGAHTERHAWVGGIAIDENANWIACGGGTETEARRARAEKRTRDLFVTRAARAAHQFKARSGWLAFFHAPSGAVMSACKTNAHQQARGARASSRLGCHIKNTGRRASGSPPPARCFSLPLGARARVRPCVRPPTFGFQSLQIVGSMISCCV